MIYLDNGATTFPKPECVWDAVDHFNRTTAVNAGRGAYQAARDATAMIRKVREQLVSLCDAREQAQVILTPSVTIALNQIIQGQKWTEHSVAYVSPYEHNAVLRPLKLLEKHVGIRVLELPLSDDLSIDLTACLLYTSPVDFMPMSEIILINSRTCICLSCIPLIARNNGSNHISSATSIPCSMPLSIRVCMYIIRSSLSLAIPSPLHRAITIASLAAARSTYSSLPERCV